MDVMFNNAGIAIGGKFGDLSHAQHEAQVQINCMGVVNGCYAGLGLLKNTPGSLLFNTASSASITGAPNLATYGASKGFVRLLTEGLSSELSEFGVRCADALPGMITTEMNPADKPGPARIGGNESAPDDSPFLFWLICIHKPQSAPDFGSKLCIHIDRSRYRRLPPSEVASAVWECYTAGERPQIHWFVPKDLEVLDKAAAQDREGTRNERLDMKAEMAVADPLDALVTAREKDGATVLI